MKVYTYSEPRQQFAEVLDIARKENDLPYPGKCTLASSRKAASFCADFVATIHRS